MTPTSAALAAAKYHATRTVLHVERMRTREHADPQIAAKMRWVRQVLQAKVKNNAE